MCPGTWPIGVATGRWPTDHGCDEWYSLQHTDDEAYWEDDPWYDLSRDPVARMLERRKRDPVPDTNRGTVHALRGLTRLLVAP